METKATVRFLSGREEHFEIELFGGSSAEGRLKEFVKDPTIVLQTEEEIIVIPSTAVESITLQFPEYGRETIDLQNVRRARRVQ